MKTAYSYVRFSTPEQAKGDSTRRQVSAAVEYCEKNGLHLDETLQIADRGISAFRGKNAKSGGLSRFLDACRSGEVKTGSVLIVESLDRISRDQILPALGVLTEILNLGIVLVTLKDGKTYTAGSVNASPFA